MVTIKLKQHYRGFNPGEIAGFPESEAEHICSKGFGEVYESTDDEEEPSKKSKSKGKKKDEDDVTGGSAS